MFRPRRCAGYGLDGCLRSTGSKHGNFGEPGIQLAVVTLEDLDSCLSRRELLLERRMPAAILLRVSGIPGSSPGQALGRHCGERRRDRGVANRSPRFGVRELSKVRIAGNSTRSRMLWPGAQR